jgi:hypothetical protein
VNATGSLAKYRAALGSIPAPGTGCHTFLLTVANLGVLAGIDPEQLFADIRTNIPAGARRIPDREIADAITKALAGGTFTPRPRPAPAIRDGQAALRNIIAQAVATTETELWDLSPVRLLGTPEDDAVLLLQTLYRHEELLFVGDRQDTGGIGKTIRPAGEWITYFLAGGQTAPHIIVNPLDGTPRRKKSGDGDTLRGDGNV